MQCVWVMILLLPAALSQRFKMVDPASPVFGVSGSWVVLPCSIREENSQNSMNVEDLTVTWSRSDLRDSVVHLYGNHKDLNTGQIALYRGRTSVFKEELQRGNTSLKLSNIRVSDEGEYSCTVDSNTWKGFVNVQLRVEAVGSQPVITVESSDSEKVSLLCKSEGWRPEPALQWMDSRGVILTAEKTETLPVSDLFSVRSSMTVKHSHIDSFSCRVTLRDHKEEGHIRASTINDHLPNPGRTAGIVIGVLLSLVLLTVGAVYLYKVKRRREEERREVMKYLNSDGDDRLLHHKFSPRQWDYVESALLKSGSDGCLLHYKLCLCQRDHEIPLLKSEQELKEFRLRKYGPSDRGVQKLKRVIASSRKALLNSCALTEESCAVLASVLSSENSLKDLNLSKNDLQDSGVKKLCEGLKSKHCKLEILSLEKCNLTKESCAVLASVLRSEKSTLKDLNLSQNDLRDSGVKELCKGLKSPHCKLETLRMSYCSITDTDFADLATALTHNSSSPLQQLDLINNQIKESEQKKQLSQLQQKLPHLTVNLVKKNG